MVERGTIWSDGRIRRPGPERAREQAPNYRTSPELRGASGRWRLPVSKRRSTRRCRVLLEGGPEIVRGNHHFGMEGDRLLQRPNCFGRATARQPGLTEPVILS